MAAFNADIALDLLTGKAERELKKLKRNVDKLERKASDINVKLDIDQKDIRRAEDLLKNLERTRKVKLQVDEQIRRSAGGDTGASTTAGLLPGLAAGSAASAGVLLQRSGVVKFPVVATEPIDKWFWLQPEVIATGLRRSVTQLAESHLHCLAPVRCFQPFPSLGLDRPPELLSLSLPKVAMFFEQR